jgi:formylmethanofuran dehydrogenase subunit A
MTPTTDLQKVDAAGLLEGVKIANKARHQFAKLDREVARMHLANAAPTLAARVLELEAENKRLREGLSGAHASLKTAAMEARHHPELRALYTKWADEAWTALKGGEI